MAIQLPSWQTTWPRSAPTWVERPVVVGHSLGGMIAVELASRYSSLPSAIVLVDQGPIDYLPETVERFTEIAELLEGADGEAFRRTYVQDMGARDPELASWIVEHMCRPPQTVAAAVVRGVSEWNGREPFARCNVPILVLQADLDDELTRLREIKPDLEIGITVDAGHFIQLEVPAQVNAMIERFLQLTT